LNDLPVEMLETVLMRAYILRYSSDYETDDDRWPFKFGKCRYTERQAFTRLSSVCWHWHQTLVGFPESPTPLWLRHTVKRLIERKYRPTHVVLLLNLQVPWARMN